jgi:preprotein translocase subunit SecG
LIHRGALPYVAPFQQVRSFMFTFLLVVQAIIAALLVTVILMQRSEGGGLTTGGSPSGLMSARGAADFLTRATSILGDAVHRDEHRLAVIAATRHSTTIDTSLQRKAAPAPAAADRPRPARCRSASGNSAVRQRLPAARRPRTARLRAIRRFRSASNRSPLSLGKGDKSKNNAPAPDSGACRRVSKQVRRFLPWRGISLSPAAWSPRLARV